MATGGEDSGVYVVDMNDKKTTEQIHYNYIEPSYGGPESPRDPLDLRLSDSNLRQPHADLEEAYLRNSLARQKRPLNLEDLPSGDEDAPDDVIPNKKPLTEDENQNVNPPQISDVIMEDNVRKPEPLRPVTTSESDAMESDLDSETHEVNTESEHEHDSPDGRIEFDGVVVDDDDDVISRVHVEKTVTYRTEHLSVYKEILSPMNPRKGTFKWDKKSQSTDDLDDETMDFLSSDYKPDRSPRPAEKPSPQPRKTKPDLQHERSQSPKTKPKPNVKPKPQRFSSPMASPRASPIPKERTTTFKHSPRSSPFASPAGSPKPSKRMNRTPEKQNRTPEKEAEIKPDEAASSFKPVPKKRPTVIPRSRESTPENSSQKAEHSVHVNRVNAVASELSEDIRDEQSSDSGIFETPLLKPSQAAKFWAQKMDSKPSKPAVPTKPKVSMRVPKPHREPEVKIESRTEDVNVFKPVSSEHRTENYSEENEEPVEMRVPKPKVESETWKVDAPKVEVNIPEVETSEVSKPEVKVEVSKPEVATGTKDYTRPQVGPSRIPSTPLWAKASQEQKNASEASETKAEKFSESVISISTEGKPESNISGALSTEDSVEAQPVKPSMSFSASMPDFRRSTSYTAPESTSTSLPNNTSSNLNTRPASISEDNLSDRPYGATRPPKKWEPVPRSHYKSPFQRTGDQPRLIHQGVGGPSIQDIRYKIEQARAAFLGLPEPDKPPELPETTPPDDSESSTDPVLAENAEATAKTPELEAKTIEHTAEVNEQTPGTETNEKEDADYESNTDEDDSYSQTSDTTSDGSVVEIDISNSMLNNITVPQSSSHDSGFASYLGPQETDIDTAKITDTEKPVSKPSPRKKVTFKIDEGVYPVDRDETDPVEELMQGQAPIASLLEPELDLPPMDDEYSDDDPPSLVEARPAHLRVLLGRQTEGVTMEIDTSETTSGSETETTDTSDSEETKVDPKVMEVVPKLETPKPVPEVVSKPETLEPEVVILSDQRPETHADDKAEVGKMPEVQSKWLKPSRPAPRPPTKPQNVFTVDTRIVTGAKAAMETDIDSDLPTFETDIDAKISFETDIDSTLPRYETDIDRDHSNRPKMSPSLETDIDADLNLHLENRPEKSDAKNDATALETETAASLESESESRPEIHVYESSPVRHVQPATIELPSSPPGVQVATVTMEPEVTLPEVTIPEMNLDSLQTMVMTMPTVTMEMPKNERSVLVPPPKAKSPNLSLSSDEGKVLVPPVRESSPNTSFDSYGDQGQFVEPPNLVTTSIKLEPEEGMVLQPPKMATNIDEYQSKLKAKRVNSDTDSDTESETSNDPNESSRLEETMTEQTLTSSESSPVKDDVSADHDDVMEMEYEPRRRREPESVEMRKDVKLARSVSEVVEINEAKYGQEPPRPSKYDKKDRKNHDDRQDEDDRHGRYDSSNRYDREDRREDRRHDRNDRQDRYDDKNGSYNGQDRYDRYKDHDNLHKDRSDRQGDRRDRQDRLDEQNKMNKQDRGYDRQDPRNDPNWDRRSSTSSIIQPGQAKTHNLEIVPVAEEERLLAAAMARGSDSQHNDSLEQEDLVYECFLEENRGNIRRLEAGIRSEREKILRDFGAKNDTRTYNEPPSPRNKAKTTDLVTNLTMSSLGVVRYSKPQEPQGSVGGVSAMAYRRRREEEERNQPVRVLPFQTSRPYNYSPQRGHPRGAGPPGYRHPPPRSQYSGSQYSYQSSPSRYRGPDVRQGFRGPAPAPQEFPGGRVPQQENHKREEPRDPQPGPSGYGTSTYPPKPLPPGATPLKVQHLTRGEKPNQRVVEAEITPRIDLRRSEQAPPETKGDQEIKRTSRLDTNEDRKLVKPAQDPRQQRRTSGDVMSTSLDRPFTTSTVEESKTKTFEGSKKVVKKTFAQRQTSVDTTGAEIPTNPAPYGVAERVDKVASLVREVKAQVRRETNIDDMEYPYGDRWGTPTKMQRNYSPGRNHSPGPRGASPGRSSNSRSPARNDVPKDVCFVTTQPSKPTEAALVQAQIRLQNSPKVKDDAVCVRHKSGLGETRASGTDTSSESLHTGRARSRSKERPSSVIEVEVVHLDSPKYKPRDQQKRRETSDPTLSVSATSNTMNESFSSVSSVNESYYERKSHRTPSKSPKFESRPRPRSQEFDTSLDDEVAEIHMQAENRYDMSESPFRYREARTPEFQTTSRVHNNVSSIHETTMDAVITDVVHENMGFFGPETSQNDDKKKTFSSPFKGIFYRSRRKDGSQHNSSFEGSVTSDGSRPKSPSDDGRERKRSKSPFDRSKSPFEEFREWRNRPKSPAEELKAEERRRRREEEQERRREEKERKEKERKELEEQKEKERKAEEAKRAEIKEMERKVQEDKKKREKREAEERKEKERKAAEEKKEKERKLQEEKKEEQRKKAEEKKERERREAEEKKEKEAKAAEEKKKKLEEKKEIERKEAEIAKRKAKEREEEKQRKKNQAKDKDKKDKDKEKDKDKSKDKDKDSKDKKDKFKRTTSEERPSKTADKNKTSSSSKKERSRSIDDTEKRKRDSSGDTEMSEKRKSRDTTSSDDTDKRKSRDSSSDYESGYEKVDFKKALEKEEKEISRDVLQAMKSPSKNKSKNKTVITATSQGEVRREEVSRRDEPKLSDVHEEETSRPEGVPVYAKVDKSKKTVKHRGESTSSSDSREVKFSSVPPSSNDVSFVTNGNTSLAWDGHYSIEEIMFDDAAFSGLGDTMGDTFEEMRGDRDARRGEVFKMLSEDPTLEEKLRRVAAKRARELNNESMTESELSRSMSQSQESLTEDEIKTLEQKISQYFEMQKTRRIQLMLKKFLAEEEGRLSKILNHSDEMLNLIAQKSRDLDDSYDRELYGSVDLGSPPPEATPPRNKRTVLYNESAAHFEDLDTMVIEVAKLETTTFSELVRDLTKNCQDEMDKLRAIYRWVTVKDLDKIEFDDHETSPLMELLRGIKDGTESYHTLFKKLCAHVGLHCQIIQGFSKGAGYRPGMNIEHAHFRNTWTAVYMNGSWRFVNCNWGARHYKSDTDDDKLTYKCDEFYFLTDPQDHRYQHFPDDEKWQLLTTPMTIQEFMRLPVAKSPFFNAGLTFSARYDDRLYTEDGRCEIELRMSKFVGFHCVLERIEDGNVTAEPEECTLIRTRDNVVIFTVAPPDIGRYYFNIYVAHDWKSNSLEHACAFQIVAGDDCYDNLSNGVFPNVGMIGRTPVLDQLGIQLPRGLDPLLMMSWRSDTILPLTVPPDIRLSHQMKLYTREGKLVGDFDQYAFLRSGRAYSVHLPKEGIYALTIFASDARERNSKMECILKYLLDCDTPNPDLSPFPRASRRWVGCTLYEPLQGQLEINSLTRFKLDIPNAVEVTVVIDDRWENLEFSERLQDAWEGAVDVGDSPGRLGVYARFDDKSDKFSPMLDYSIVKRRK